MMKEKERVEEMNKMKGKIVRNIFLTLIALCGIWVIFSNVSNIYEQNKYPAIGKLVEVNGEKMHVYEKGEGEHTIVLLSGLGTAAPALDFEPLMNELARNNKVVVVEPFGYGWSDITNKERTVQNIVEETRLALNKANVEGPYILMPHSISGIYSMYYANTYPDEVEAIIGIDPTLPQSLGYFEENAPTMPNYLTYVAPTGLARLAISLDPEGYLPITNNQNTYSKENLRMTKAISAWKGYNKSIVKEANEIQNNVNRTVEMKFPSSMPVLIFTKSVENKTEDGKNNITFYETQLSTSSGSEVIELDGHHYLHWTEFKEMSSEVNNFIEVFSKN